MRVLHVISTTTGVGGAETVLAHLVRAGRSAGHELLVCNPFGREGADSGLRELVGLDLYRCGNSPGSSGAIPAAGWLRARIREFRPHLVHAHLFHASVLTALVSGSRTSTLLTHHHGDYYAQQGRSLHEWADAWATRRFDHVVAVSESVRQFVLARDRRLDPGRVHRIPNGWEGTPLPREEPDTPTVLCVGRFRPEKGHLLLLDAFAQVLRQLPGSRLLLVGDGPTRPHVEARISELSLRKHVDLLGQRTDIWPLYASAHVLAVPSILEAFGLVAAEAMAAGLPVVATRVGGLPDVVAHQETGLLVEPGEARALADALLVLLRNHAARARMSAAAVQRGSSFRADRMAEDYFRLYGQMTG